MTDTRPFTGALEGVPGGVEGGCERDCEGDCPDEAGGNFCCTVGAGLTTALLARTRSGDTSKGGKPVASAVPDIQHSSKGIKRTRVLRCMTGQRFLSFAGQAPDARPC